MKYCQQCGRELIDDAAICIGCGSTIGALKKALDNRINIGFCILSFFMPLFGIVYWAVVSGWAPKRARACGITAIVSIVISFVVTLILIVMFVGWLVEYANSYEYLYYGYQ
ncbi:MAG: hypothetical protein IJW16_05280 [Clostridia bacterium]|nr:hypothetical protein [Clostridia bacterium]